MADPLLAAPLDANGFYVYNQAPGYTQKDYEKTSTFVYVGLENTPGEWVIYRRTVASNVRLSAAGSSGYSAGWSGRAGLTYS